MIYFYTCRSAVQPEKTHERTRMYRIVNFKDVHALYQELALDIEKQIKGNIANRNFLCHSVQGLAQPGQDISRNTGMLTL